jgi:glutamine---fructose-6-phosphate transaminase (isomerizing)
LLARLHDEVGVELIVASDDPATLALGHALSLPGGTPEWAAPVSAAVATQLFCHHLAVARGMDPDAPRALRKVTRTR